MACIFGVGLFGSTYLVPLFVQTVQHLTPYAAGLLLMPGGLILAVFLPLGGYLSDRVPARPLIVAGLLCFAVSTYWLARVDVNTSFWFIAWCVIISRIGLGLIKPALNLAALRSLRPELLGQGREDQLRAHWQDFRRELRSVSSTAARRSQRTSDTCDGATALRPRCCARSKALAGRVRRTAGAGELPS